MNKKTLKIIVIISLIVTFFSPPYFYYQLLKWFVCVASIYLAYNYQLDNPKHNKKILLIIIAILFNPITPIYFGRELWIIIDVIVVVFYGFILQDDK